MCIRDSIIVSVITAEKQANIHKHNLSRELRWLVCHGFLHLLGWDHLNAQSLNRMLKFQDQLLRLANGLKISSFGGFEDS